jgi:hypothetical protein
VPWSLVESFWAQLWLNQSQHQPSNHHSIKQGMALATSPKNTHRQTQHNQSCQPHPNKTHAQFCTSRFGPSQHVITSILLFSSGLFSALLFSSLIFSYLLFLSLLSLLFSSLLGEKQGNISFFNSHFLIFWCWLLLAATGCWLAAGWLLV